MTLAVLAWLLTLSAALTGGLAARVWTAAVLGPLPDGPRGRARARARRRGLRFVDPCVRRLALVFAPLHARMPRGVIEAWLVRGGDFLGLDAAELVSLCVLWAGGGFVLAAILSAGAAPAAPLAGLALGAMLPVCALRRAIVERGKSIARGLPGAIDLLALCTGAGLDFASALALVAGTRGACPGALGEELEHVLREISLGHTRERALRSFAARVPIAAVSELVGAIVQADQKGHALGPVLEIQAQMLRMRRSVAAEHAAARASVLMLLPLMLLMGAILLVLFAPFAIEGMGGL